MGIVCKLLFEDSKREIRASAERAADYRHWLVILGGESPVTVPAVC